MSNYFEYATRSKLRFTSSRGDLTVEQLWDVPLRSRDDFNLNAIAKAINKAVKAVSEENFVDTTRSFGIERLEVTLEIVKHIIDVKLTEEKRATTLAAKKQEKEKLFKILAEKQDGKLSELSIEELNKRIADLDA